MYERAIRQLLMSCCAQNLRVDAVPSVIFPFVELPHIPGGWPRPVLDVVVGNMGEVLVPCLVDSGATNTLLPSWV
ncbi:MAG: hypothetical protein ACRDTA_25240, partial [Pseudonocardiaceae bacterium]